MTPIRRFAAILVLALGVTAAPTRFSTLLADCPWPYDNCSNFTLECVHWCANWSTDVCQFECLEPVEEGNCVTSFCNCCW